MQSYLDELEYDFSTELVDLPINLANLLDGPIIINNGCFLIKQLSNRAPSDIDDLKKSVYEYSSNHFHPDSYIGIGIELKDIDHLKLGLECARRVALRLSREFSDIHFKILLSYTKTEYRDNEVYIYASSTIRFFRDRPVDEGQIYDQDLNAYELDAILEIKT